MGTNELDGRLISFDEAGFTGPHLLDEQQPYFVYASHDMTGEEADTLIATLRNQFRLQGNELKSSRLKKRNDWSKITLELCSATQGRSRVVVHNKKAALAGKFFEYFFEPVLADNSMLFYRWDFHRYLMTTVYVLMQESSAEYSVLSEQMQEFMRVFDPSVAPDIFCAGGRHPVEIDRILKFCRGYTDIITNRTRHLRPDAGDSGKWTLDLTSTALFSLLFFSWGHKYPRLRLLCDDSKPLAAARDLFDDWVGKDQSAPISDGKSSLEIKGNLVAPVEFGSSKSHSTIQVADLLAGMTLDFHMSAYTENKPVKEWLQRHQLHSHSVDFLPEFTKTSDRRVRIGREILKELANRADTGADPLNGMNEFVRRTVLRFK
tara:strand:+ start:4542 stop:5669 length:1128 start_codon:yes stop_codon:yes gene_type:complete